MFGFGGRTTPNPKVSTRYLVDGVEFESTIFVSSKKVGSVSLLFVEMAPKFLLTEVKGWGKLHYAGSKG